MKAKALEEVQKYKKQEKKADQEKERNWKRKNKLIKKMKKTWIFFPSNLRHISLVVDFFLEALTSLDQPTPLMSTLPTTFSEGTSRKGWVIKNFNVRYTAFIRQKGP